MKKTITTVVVDALQIYDDDDDDDVASDVATVVAAADCQVEQRISCTEEAQCI